MRLVGIVLVYRAEVALAQRRIVGERTWLSCLVDRLKTAKCVTHVAVMCDDGAAVLRECLDADSAQVVETSDPIRSALALEGDHDGVTFCPVSQLFADPLRLDALVERVSSRITERAFAVLDGDDSLSLSGGAFLDVLTHRGLSRLADGDDLTALSVTRWPTWPEPPEMRLDPARDVEWAAAVQARLLTVDASGAAMFFDAVVREAGLTRSALWDGIGVPPLRVLTVRCLRGPLFQGLVEHVARIPEVQIDVVCSRALADATSRMAGVTRVIPFEGSTFDLAALAPSTLASLRAARYDLCVIPRREPSGVGFENASALAEASRARAGMWLDVFGRAGLISGHSQGWDPATWPRRSRGADSCASPATQAGLFERRAAAALERFSAGGRVADELLDSVDENLVCRGLLDNPSLGIDLSTPLLCQLPASAEIARHLAQLDREQPEIGRPFSAAVDALYRRAVGLEAPHALGEAPADTRRQFTDVLEPLALALGRLADHRGQEVIAAASANAVRSTTLSDTVTAPHAVLGGPR